MERLILTLKQTGEHVHTTEGVMIIMFINQRVDSYLQLSKWSKGISIIAFVTAFCCLCATDICQRFL